MTNEGVGAMTFKMLKLWVHIVQCLAIHWQPLLHLALGESCSSWSEPQLLLFIPPGWTPVSVPVDREAVVRWSFLVGAEERIIKSDPLVQCSLITFSPDIHWSSLLKRWSSSRACNIVMVNLGHSANEWEATRKFKSCWSTVGNTELIYWVQSETKSALLKKWQL